MPCTAVELGGQGTLRITSVGAAGSAAADKNELFAGADAARYGAQREGKKRPVGALPESTHQVIGQ